MSGGERTELEKGPGGIQPTALEGAGGPAGPTELEDRPGAPAGGFIAHNLPAPLAEEYRIVRRLGLGGQGSVYLCERIVDGHQVAIKLYSVAMSRLDATVIEKLATAPAEHIVPTTFGQWGEECWEIQEYLPLGTIGDIRQHFAGTLPDAVAHAVVADLTEAVAAAHARELLHRDIKPSNILIRSLDPIDLVLADFGLVRNLLAGAQVGSRSATPGYRSPDTAQGIWRLESDWWAVGITLYELLCERHPFDDENGYRKDEVTILGYLIENEVPLDGVEDPRWQLLLRGLLTKSADHRWGADQVRAWLAGDSPTIHQSTAPKVADRGWAFAGFGGQEFTSVDQLGRALASRWDEAAEYLNGRGKTMLHNALAQSSVATEAHRTFDRHDRKLITTDGLVFELVRLLAPDDRLVFRGRPLTPDSLAAAGHSAVNGDEGAASWISALRREHVLTNTMGDAQHTAFARIDNQLNSWWDTLDATTSRLDQGRRSYYNHAVEGRAPSVALPATITPAHRRFEGELLLAALSPDHAEAIQQAVRSELEGRPATAGWVDPLRVAVDSDQAAPVEALLLMATLSLADEDHAQAQDAEIARRRREAAAEAEQRRQRRRARVRAARPDGGDYAFVFLAGAGCITVLVPWLLGTFALDGAFGRDNSGLVPVDGARSFGTYFLSNWIAGCAALLMVLAAVLGFRALLGRRIGAAVLGVLGLVGALILVPISDDKWDAAEQATANKAYDPEFENFFTCGGAVSETEPAWSVWTFRIKDSPFEGCNRVRLYRGLTEVESINLDGRRRYRCCGFGSGSPVSVNNPEAEPSSLIFTYEGDGGAPVIFRVADYQ
ncbi:protein kinase domain-containing protein [Nocardioides immobilis]|uniref:protein kinase domain-containing protein n=1 Tax=Nocardioides immobilis TaxID=2049295 RepID=UPI0015F94FD2|nr:serine/threonine-protein kinase [Nocardioides immobilis]